MKVLQACEIAGVDIPRFCYHSRLSIAGNCRMCLVEVEKSPPKPVASCAMPALPGAHSHGAEATSTDYDKVTQSHYEFLGSYLGSCERAKGAIIYSYTKHINGFAAYLREEEATQVSKNPDVVSVFLNQGRKLHTTRSWDFMGLEENGEISSSSIWKKARLGEDAIIGNLDTVVVLDIAGVQDLGMLGRGSGEEIGTYVEKLMTSELSGNVIDICPGALTSKPFAFKARNWELRGTETIDASDAVGSNIRIDSRGPEIFEHYAKTSVKSWSVMSLDSLLEIIQ